jgi:hypothetical protein
MMPYGGCEPPARLYERDFYAWTQQMATVLRFGKWEELDREALAEEIESLGGRDRRELRRRVQRLVTHLLKWRYQPARRGRGWQLTIRTQRQDIVDLLNQSPSLRCTVPAAMADRYALAREHASAQTRLPLTTFPETCPWTPEQVLDADFWPAD